MAKFTNFTRGPRGISMKDGSTTWLEPGESADLDKKDIVEPLPDLGRKADAVAEVDTAELDDLKKQVAALTKQVEDDKKALDEVTKANAALTKQVEDLTKPKN